jgi:hypothetical protein
MPFYEEDVTFDPQPLREIVPSVTPVDKFPRNLAEGETQRYIDGDRIVTRERVDGVTYETSTDSDTEIKNITNLVVSEDSLGSSNVTFEFENNNIVCRDDSHNIRAQFGQISSGNSFGMATFDSSGNELMNISGNQAVLAGWTIGTNLISKTNSSTGHTISMNADTQPRLQVQNGSNTLVKVGMLTASKAGFQLFKSDGSTEVFKADEDGAMIAGWDFTETLFRSESSGARIELNADKNRVSIFDDSDEKVVMGYLDGLAKNDGSGDWGSNDYGFWAKDGDSLQIDGDMQYESGDWMVQNDASLKIHDGDGDEIIRLGTYSGAKGLFIGDDIDSTAPLARYEKAKILIGDESGEYLRYTTAGGLEINGDITVTGDTSTLGQDDYKSGALDTGKWTIIGNVTQTSTNTGIGLSDTTDDAAWDSGVRWSQAFKREHAPTFYCDMKILTVGSNNNNHMVGWFKDKTTAGHLSSLLYGIYLSDNDLIWRHGGSNNYGSTTSHYGMTNTLAVGQRIRLVIQVKTGGGANGYIYLNGDYQTPYI